MKSFFFAVRKVTAPFHIYIYFFLSLFRAYTTFHTKSPRCATLLARIRRIFAFYSERVQEGINICHLAR